MPEQWYPEARRRPLSEALTQRTIVPRLGIAHSQAGVGSLWSFFENASSLESTMWFGVRGEVEQYVPVNTRADANLKANGFAVSFETENHLDYVRMKAWDLDPWSPEQVTNITRFCNWLVREWGLPPQLTPSWDGAGFGWHIMFGTPGPWTPVAKACPGRRRIEQFRQIVMPAVTGELYGGEPMDDALGLKIIAGVDAILKDDFARLGEQVNKDITNAANRVIRDLGGTPSIPDKR